MLNTSVYHIGGNTTNNKCEVHLNNPSSGFIQKSNPVSRFIRFQRGSDIEKLLLDNGVELKEDISKSDDLNKILEYMKETEKSNERYIEKRLKEDITLTLKDISNELNKPKKYIKRSYEKVLARIEGRTKICERCGEEFIIKNDNIKICESCIRAIEIKERFPEIFEK